MICHHLRARVAVLGVCSLVLLGGCSADDPAPVESTPVEQTVPADTAAPEDAPASEDAPEEVPSGKPDTVVDISDQPGSGDYAGALDDASLKSCESADGALQVAGTVTNPEAGAQSYRIYVSAMQGKETRGLVQVELEAVPAGETQEWATTVDLPDADLTCLLRVERRG